MGCIPEFEANELFLQNALLVSSTIRNMTVTSPNWFRDVINPQIWPVGEGNIMEELTLRGELPAIEEGFDSWGLVEGAADVCGEPCLPNCGYNMSTLGGQSISAKLTRLMTKDFRTPDFCVKTIQSTRQFEMMFSQMIQNMYNQIDFQKEVNVGQNYMRLIAKKFLIDGAGFQPNPEDPWVYRPKGTATLSLLTVDLATRLYQTMKRMMSEPYAVQNGMPMYAMVASDEFFADLYRLDPTIRADIRAQGGTAAADLVNKYNFTTSIRDMFFAVPYPYPARFYWSGTAWIRVYPFIKGVPGIVGTFGGLNPKYEDPGYATHEEVLIHGANPFSVYYQPTVKTLGEGSDFGPANGEEPGFWDVFYWINPQTRDDPMRRVGYYMTTATIALKAENSESVFAVLVPRRPVSNMVGYFPSATCPPEAVACGNTVPAVGCPTPMVVSVTPHLITAGRYWITVGAPIDAEASDVIQLQMDNGGFVNATVVTASTDLLKFEVTISGTLPVCDRFVAVWGGDSLGCSATVVNYQTNAADNTRIDLILDRPIKAYTATNAVTLYYGNGTTASATVISADMIANKWVVDIGGSAFSNQVGGVVGICVPTATDATCGACTTAFTSVTQCTEA